MAKLVSNPRPFFLSSKSGRIFAVYHEPVIPVRGNILVIPPFNEEMNRCRSMVTIQAQDLARHGVGTLVLDLFGTGESDGFYGDARWDIWLENIRCARTWLVETKGGCSALLGIRLGVPLAFESISADRQPSAIIAWQAINDGKQYLTQFMRMRIAGNMDRTDIPKETTGGLRAQLATGRSIEVAGYEIHPEMAAALDMMRLDNFSPDIDLSVAWFEKGNGENLEISPSSRSLLDSWRHPEGKIEVDTFDGPAFWALHDRFLAPELIEKTSNWLVSWLANK